MGLAMYQNAAAACSPSPGSPRQTAEQDLGVAWLSQIWGGGQGVSVLGTKLDGVHLSSQEWGNFYPA